MPRGMLRATWPPPYRTIPMLVRAEASLQFEPNRAHRAASDPNENPGPDASSGPGPRIAWTEDRAYFATASSERSAIPFRTSSAELASAAFSSAVRGTSTIFSIPFAPRMQGTPR